MSNNDFNLNPERINESHIAVIAPCATLSKPLMPEPVTPTLEQLTFQISEFSNSRDNHPKPKTYSWDSFCKAYSVNVEQRQKDGQAWSPASYAEGATRKKEHVQHVSMAVIDADNGTPISTVMQRLEGIAFLAHSSYSHTAELPKYRVIIPFAKPVTADQWPEIWLRVNQHVGGCNDPATKDASRLYYKPAHPPGNEHFVNVGKGRPLGLDDLPVVSTPVVTHPPLTFNRKAYERSTVIIEGIESSGLELGFEQGLSEVVGRCGFMGFASEEKNQAAISEPLWQAMISNGCRFENSDAWIHAASSHHPEYDESETDKKIHHAREGSAPITCSRIRELGFQNCPNGGCRTANHQITKAPAGLAGWMFQKQLTTDQTASGEMPDAYEIGDFSISDLGVFQTTPGKDGTTRQIKLCSRIDVSALTRDPRSENWGLELRFKDPDGVSKSWALPKELLAGNGDSYRAPLLKMGATIEPSNQAKTGLAQYLVAAEPKARALSVRQPGWFNDTFVLPNAVYGRSTERVVFQTNDPSDITRFSQQGTLHTWQQHVAGPSQGNSRAVFSICAGLAAPLLYLLNEDNSGFHLRGNSSIGKSVCLSLGSSVWGGAALIRTWNMTTNGLEGVAALHNDILLPLDELGQADPKMAGDAAYMLGNGQGKSRATKDGDARGVKRWRNIVLSSGEKSMATMMAQAGHAIMAGQDVRMPEIPADAGCGYGIFENIHGAVSSQLFADQLKKAATEHHGHAGRAFVAQLADPEQQARLVERARHLIEMFVNTNVPEGSVGQVGRVGHRFGLIAAAGELCTELGILPWSEGEAFAACRKCFMAWIDVRGGVGNHEAEQAVAQVRQFIGMHGNSRFSLISNVVGIETSDYHKTVNRAGYRSQISDYETEYFILPEVYRTEICSGLNPGYVTKVLVDRGFLAKDKNGKPQIEKRIPGEGKMRLYHLKAGFLANGVSQIDEKETDVRQPEAVEMAVKYSV